MATSLHDLLDRDIEPAPEMTPDDALVVAVRLHRLGQRAAAMELYQRILAVVPDQPDALHFLGIGHHQAGDQAQALACIERAMQLHPDHADMHLNHGNILLELGRFDEATAAYRRAAELGWQHAALHNNLGVLHRSADRPHEAEQAYLQALAVDPDYVDAHTNLANLYAAQGRIEDAMRHGSLALVLQPQHPRARQVVALAYHTLGRADEAAAIYRQWLDEEPDNPQPRHYLAACTGVGVPVRAADAYVEAVFDGFANSFDAKLGALTYRAPQLLGQMVQQRCGAPTRTLDVLDAGCGTGLCAPHLAHHARRLDGVDLSGQMLEKARQRGGYDALHKAELTAFLRAHPAGYDLVASADTLCYFGALDEVVLAAAQALRDGGQLLFTVEASPDTAPGSCTLHPHGRYSHRRDHVQRVLEAAGLHHIEIHAAHLRLEGGKPVEGWVVAARRPAQEVQP